MKKSKGYTLAELLVIIAIIGLLISITSYSITRVLKASKDNIKEQELNSLVDAGKTFMNAVIDGSDKFRFNDINIGGYDFIEHVATKCSSYGSNKECSQSSAIVNGDEKNYYTVKLYPANLTNYIDTSKYYDGGRCEFVVKLEINKNKNGYYIVDGIEVNPASGVKGKTCVR